jgi:hypothetical protein
VAVPRPRNYADDIRRDEIKNLLGRTPAQDWIKPEVVELSKPRPVTSRNLIDERNDKYYVDRAELKFVLEPLWSGFSSQATPVRASPDLLERFLRLATAPAPQIHKFASSFGPLLIFCRAKERKSLPEKLIIVESCEVWRYFAASMLALLRIASCFHADRKPDPADWDRIGACPAPLVPTRLRHLDPLSFTSMGGEQSWVAMAHFVGKGADRDRKMWALFLNVLLELGRVRPWLVWEGTGGSARRPKLVFSGSHLLSYLALQLCLMASKHDAFAVCSFCSCQYVPLGRAPKTGQRNFCPDCRESGVPGMLAQRARRERLQQESVAGT